MRASCRVGSQAAARPGACRRPRVSLSSLKLSKRSFSCLTAIPLSCLQAALRSGPSTTSISDKLPRQLPLRPSTSYSTSRLPTLRASRGSTTTGASFRRSLLIQVQTPSRAGSQELEGTGELVSPQQMQRVASSPLRSPGPGTSSSTAWVSTAHAASLSAPDNVSPPASSALPPPAPHVAAGSIVGADLAPSFPGLMSRSGTSCDPRGRPHTVQTQGAGDAGVRRAPLLPMPTPSLPAPSPLMRQPSQSASQQCHTAVGLQGEEAQAGSLQALFKRRTVAPLPFAASSPSKQMPAGGLISRMKGWMSKQN